MIMSEVIHYHGTPIWGDKSEVHKIAVTGTGAFVSYARPDQIEQSFKFAKSVAIDNGAFSAWKRGLVIDWNEFYKWLEGYYYKGNLSFFVIPDVIEGGEEDNDRLIDSVPSCFKGKAVPVWHLHESLDRLKTLSSENERICFGSSGEYAVIRTKAWHRRMHEAFNVVIAENKDLKVHGLRMLDGRVLGNYPLSSADSTNLACNVPKFDKKYPELTKNVTSSDFVIGLSDKDVKSLVLKHRCAIIKNTIEMVRPPSYEEWTARNLPPFGE